MPRPIRRALAFVMAAGLLGSLEPVFTAPREQVLIPQLAPATPRQDAGSLVPWQDREFRTTYVPDIDQTHMFLALQPVDPIANEPLVTMVFAARFRGRNPSVPPGQIEMRVTPHPLFDPRRVRLPILTFFLNRGTEESEQLDFSGIFATGGYLSNPTGPLNPSGQAPPPQILGPLLTGAPAAAISAGDAAPVVSSSVETVLFTLPVGLQLLRILNAENVEGTAVGVLDFSFTEAQLDALRDFVNRILVPGGNRRRR